MWANVERDLKIDISWGKRDLLTLAYRKIEKRCTTRGKRDVLIRGAKDTYYRSKRAAKEKY